MLSDNYEVTVPKYANICAVQRTGHAIYLRNFHDIEDHETLY